MSRRSYWIAYLGLDLALAGHCLAATSLGVRGTEFTINGRPEFLLGISYYGGLGSSEETLKADLDQMQRHRFNWLRLWATWAAFGGEVSAVDGEGAPREQYFARLKTFVAECDRRGIIVDVSLSRGNGVTGPSRLQDLPGHRRAVELLAKELKPWRNWYLDLSNERNIQDKRFTSFEDLAQLREAVRKIDSDRLVTASQGGDIGREELRKYLEVAKVDFICPHRERSAKSPSETGKQTREYLKWMKELGRSVPVHYQEPFRRGYADWNPSAEDFLTDLQQAKESRAAGWCFHNGSQRTHSDGIPRRSFDLREKRLFEQLDDVERQFLSKLLELTDRNPASRR